MTFVRSLVTLPIAVFLGLLSLLLLLGTPGREAPIAFAGPCAGAPLLFFEDNDSAGVPDLYTSPGRRHRAAVAIDTLPEELPPGKDPVTITVKKVEPEADIPIILDPSSSDGSFGSTMKITIGQGVAPGIYTVTVELYCHEITNTYTFDIFVSTCPAPSAPQGSAPTPTEEPFPAECTEPSPTPTAPATSTPTASPTENPSGTPAGQQVPWGDIDCDGAITTRDNQALLREILDQNALSQTEPCPDPGDPVSVSAPQSGSSVWGDADCDGAVSTRDNQAVLRNVLQQNALSQTEPCPDVGSPVVIMPS